MDIKRHTFKLSEYEGMIREVLAKDGHFRMYPRGTSMLPLIRQEIDSVVLVKAGDNPKVGEIAFYLRDDGSYVLHRIVGRKRYDNAEAASGNGVKKSDAPLFLYTMCGDNQIVKEKGIRRDQIIGVVEIVYRKDKAITAGSPGYRLYRFVWKSFFIRRVFFMLRRIKNKIFG